MEAVMSDPGERAPAEHDPSKHDPAEHVSGEQGTFEELPKEVREDFERMKVRLGSELTIGTPRRVKGGWVASIYTLDGQYGGDLMAMDPPSA
jgi:hypothetical protein